MSSSEIAKRPKFKRLLPFLAVPVVAAVLYAGYRVDRAAAALEAASGPVERTITREALAFDQEMAGLDPSVIMSPEALQADPGMRRTRAKLAERRQAIERYRVRTTELPSLEQKEVLEILDLELALTAELDAVADMLAAAEGHWRLDGDRLVFDRPVDQAALDARIRNMRDVLARQDAVRARALASGAIPVEDLPVARRGGG